MPVQEKIKAESDDELKIIVGGIEIVPTSAEIVRAIDTGADGWTATIEWIPGENAAFDEATKPYSYAESLVYIGGNLVIAGKLYGVRPNFSNLGRFKILDGFSHTVDMVDSNIMQPYEYYNITIEDLIPRILANTGFENLEFATETDTGGPFQKVTVKESETVFAFLTRLAKQRGVLISNTATGEILITSANTGARPIGVIEEGEELVGLAEISADYNGRKRFNQYKVYGNSPEKSSFHHHLFDDGIPKGRTRIMRSDDATPGNIDVTAEWLKNRHVVDAESISFPVPGWLAPDGGLWEPNTTVVVKSETIDAKDGKTFFIRAVKHNLTGDGRVTTLSLVPPEAYELGKNGTNRTSHRG